MNLESKRQVIKAVCRWRYDLSLSEDECGLYHLSVQHKFVLDTRESAVFHDYKAASDAFDNKVQELEGH